MQTICFCNSTLAWGGGEKWHLEAALAFAQRGHRVFLAAHPKGALYKAGMEAATKVLAASSKQGELHIIPLPLSRFSFLNPLFCRQIQKILLQIQPHAVVLNLPSDLKAIGPAAKTVGVKHIVFRRGSALPVQNSMLNRYLYGKVITRLIVNSKATQRQVYVNNSNIIPKNRVTLLPNGIDVQHFDAQLAACANDARGQFFPDLVDEGVNQLRPFIIGNAGRLNKQKGQHLFLKIARELLEAGSMHGIDFRFIIAGEGERRQELEALAQSLGIENKVVFTGFLQNLAPFWRSIDCFLLTSLWEGFGFVLAEAMLAYKPVVAFNVSSIPELVADGKNGLLFTLPQEEQINSPEVNTFGKVIEDHDPVQGILKLAMDIKEQERMGWEGRKLAVERFEQEGCMDRLESLLELK